MMSTCIGQSVYFPDHAAVWNCGVIVDANGGDVTVDTHDQEPRTISKHAILPKEEDASADAADNICSMNHLHEASILFHLERRFKKPCVYTFANNICIAVNPYKRVVCPDLETRRKYSTSATSGLPPHVFSVSARAVSLLREDGANQSVIVSGESGAGKTETVKLLLAHVAELSVGWNGSRDGSALQVLEGSTVLESFGNASTAQNDNSSRFGKFLSLRFDESLRMLESGCTTYLLEKCRVVRQGSAAAERNFHVFYELLCAPDDVRTRLALQEAGAEDFQFMQRRPLSAAQRQEYALRFAETDKLLRCTMKALPGSRPAPLGDVQDVYAVLAGILYLGELQGKFTADAVQCASMSAAKLLGVTEDSLEATLAHRRVVVGDSCIHVPLSDAETCRARDALAKDIYVRVFDWLVRTVNEAHRGSATVPPAARPSQQRCISLLDIFGFEVFEENRFEQLCINYANEALQRLFAHEVIQAVQCEYAQEGILWADVPFQDNSEVLELIEGRLGVFHLLNEECVVPAGADASFVSKLCATQRACSQLQPERTRARCFTIKHYAGSVTYDADGFLDKNRDTLLPHSAALMAQSRNPFLAELFRATDAEDPDSKPRGGKRSASTVAFKFRAQLNSLVAHLQSTKLHFVRCIKPNRNKSPDEFDRGLVVQQLRSAGIVAAASVSQSAYPGKLSRGECVRLVRMLLPRGAPQRFLADAASLQLTLRDELGVAAQVGISKVYFEPGQLETLSTMVGSLKLASVVKIQAWARAVQRRVAFASLRRAVIRLQSWVRRVLGRARFRRFRAAAASIQAAWRRRVLLWQQRRTAAAVRVLQTWIRGRLASVRRRAGNPPAAHVRRAVTTSRHTQTCDDDRMLQPRRDGDWERLVEEFEDLRILARDCCCPRQVLGRLLLQLPMLVVSAAVIAVLAQ